MTLPSVTVGRAEWLGCAGLLAFVGLTAGSLWLLLYAIGAGASAVVGPLVVGVVSLVAFGMLQESVRISSDERLVRAAARGEQVLENGQPAVASGVIEPVAGQEPIDAPFTGRRCLDYRYTVRGRAQSTAVVFFGGIGHVPSQVRTPAGALRILGLPSLEEVEERWCERPEERERAIAYVRGVTFETLGVFDWGRVYRLGRRLFTETGPTRKDLSTGLGDPNPESCAFQEAILEPNAVVTVIGRYSAEGRGLAPDVKLPLSLPVLAGDAASVARALRARVRMRAGAALAIVALVYLGILVAASLFDTH